MIRSPFITQNNQLTDRSAMPFGKFKGQPMENVTVNYLHYLWHSGLKNDHNSLVGDYIRRNLDSLRSDDPDLLW